MKKGKTTLLALSVGALTYLAFLGFDLKNPEKPAAVAKPYAAESVASTPVLPPVVAPRRVKARRSVAGSTFKTVAVAASTEASETQDTKKVVKDIPLPKPWDGSFVKHDRPYDKDECDIDRPCSPRGRDGVLLVGVSFSLNGYRPMAPEILAVGSYQQRTPLLVYR